MPHAESTDVPDIYVASLLTEYFLRLFLTYLGEELYALDQKIPLDEEISIIEAFREWFLSLYTQHGWNTETVTGSADAEEFWINSSDAIWQILMEMYPKLKLLDKDDLEGAGYDFVPFSSHSIGFGLQLTYRQHWRLIELRPSEIVKTIPLGPRQTERVRTRVTTSTRRVVTRDSTTVIETSEENTTTNRTTHDIVSEAAVRRWTLS